MARMLLHKIGGCGDYGSRIEYRKCGRPNCDLAWAAVPPGAGAGSGKPWECVVERIGGAFLFVVAVFQGLELF
jgi:hypothetical protein